MSFRQRKEVNIAVGQVFVISAGEYSDYHYKIVARALKPITDEVILSYLGKPDRWGRISQEYLINNLNRLGYLEELDTVEINFDGYEGNTFESLGKVGE